MNDVLIYGGGQLGRQMHYFLAAHGQDECRVLGCVDDVRTAGEQVTEGLWVVGNLESIAENPDFDPNRCLLVLAIGYTDMLGRDQAFNRAKALGYEFLTLIHPQAIVEQNVRLGEGVMIMAGAVVDQYNEIGDITYLDIGTSVGENGQIGTNNYLAAGTSIGGNVTIGRDNFLGMDTTVTNDVSIGDFNLINAKTMIYKNLGDEQKVVEVRKNYIKRRPDIG